MSVAIDKILALKFLPIIDSESIKNPVAFIETVLEQEVDVLQINFKIQEQIQESYKIWELLKKYPEIKVGAGFLYSSEDTEKIINNGANFVVSSVLAKEILKISNSYNIPAIISGFTPTEIFEAHKLNSELVQIFPAAQIDEKSIISIIDHMPKTYFLLTGGLTLSRALDFIRCGVQAVGVKGCIFQNEYLQEENYFEIGKSIKNFKDRIQQIHIKKND